ncbi:hypothetical protein AgCh_026275 [Apium graveolens]
MKMMKLSGYFKRSACSHGGLLGEALTIFCSMERDFGVIPRSDHCAALIAKATKALFELEPMNSGRYVMLSNMYAAAGKWDDASQISNHVLLKIVLNKVLRMVIPVNALELHFRHSIDYDIYP